MLAVRLPALSGRKWTASRPLPGGDFTAAGIGDLVTELRAEHPFLDETQALRIARSYGTRARNWLGEAQMRGDLGRDFGHGLSQSEVDYLRGHEWTMTAEDVLWRRTKLGLYLDSAQQAALADYIGG